MGLFKKFVNQTRKPEFFFGKMMVSSMNSGHAKVADWGISHLKEMEAGLKKAGFSKIESDHHKYKPWLAVIAQK